MMGTTSRILPTTLSPGNLSNINVTMTTVSQTTTPAAGSHVMAYILVPLGSLALVALLAFVVSFA